MPVERVQRALARAGFGSRRACEELIVDGRVTVNGTVATLGDRVDPETDAVGRRRGHGEPRPQREVLRPAQAARASSRRCTTPKGGPTSAGSCPTDGPRVFPVGRLDRDSEGLLLLTNDGELAQPAAASALRGREGVPRRGRRRADRRARSPRIRAGVELDDGLAKAERGARRWPSSGPRGAVRLVMTEGRKREVRRLLAEVGLPVDPAGASAGRSGRSWATSPPRRAHATS